MIKYKTYPYGIEIREIAVTKETEHFYTFENGNREKKKSKWHNYFDTRVEARRFLIEKAEHTVEGCQRRLKEAEDDYVKAVDICLE